MISEEMAEKWKGDLAQIVVEDALRKGKFSIPVDIGSIQLVKDIKKQIDGMDIIFTSYGWVFGIQVKCDYCAGRGHPDCTGNLFIQIEERNPNCIY